MITDYKTLTIGQYLDIIAVDKEEGLDEIERQVKVDSILSGISEDELLHLPLHEYREVAKQAQFLSTPPEDLPDIKDEYVTGGFTLVPVKDYRQLETGQYIDFKGYAQNVTDNFVGILSVLLVPKGHRYNEGYDIYKVQQAIKDIPMPDGLAMVAFFLTSWTGLMEDSLNYSEREALRISDPQKREKTLKEIQTIRETLRQSGDGLQR